ncbi:CDP-glucose 4,6-dehydratase [Rhodohalobacter halophilus]|uniref:CDP-glucose 4,6-dehydratase n=1 Tax=Rhodohalobacter halophilus TaxID=1812810 RepID=UPI00083F9F5E|nr:CDP-glucose 4,6-dehydratase [Rhodohalobacter halophilus]
MVTNLDFWEGKKVFLTGHTGFKGSWMTIWLKEMGAQVIGYSVDIPTNPSLFEEADLVDKVHHIKGDVTDFEFLLNSIKEADPDVLIHMAAQPLVRLSYEIPRETYETNVMGTVNVLEAVRHIASIKSTVIVTTDKCYENREWEYGYREIDPMGGYDPYSNSKGAAELVVSAYNNSFFKGTDQVVCSARAGNVIGGGDWALDRLVPDVIQSIKSGDKVKIRNPKAIRPWQHVLEPLSGYLLLAEKAYVKEEVRGGWNFGPSDEDAQNVQWVAEKIGEVWGEKDVWIKDGDEHPHEANYLKLDISKARMNLKWTPKWSASKAVETTTKWYKDFYTGTLKTPDDVYQRCVTDLNEYLSK